MPSSPTLLTPDSELLQRIRGLRSQLEKEFAPDTAAPGFAGNTPSTGHCAAVSTIIHEILGGDLVSAKVSGVSHWFNRLPGIDGLDLDVDLTGDQFGLSDVQVAAAGQLYPETRVRTFHELNYETLARARTLAARSGFPHVVAVIDRALNALPIRKPSK